MRFCPLKIQQSVVKHFFEKPQNVGIRGQVGLLLPPYGYAGWYVRWRNPCFTLIEKVRIFWHLHKAGKTMEYAIAKGVFDIIPVERDPEEKWRESHRWQHVEEVIRKAAAEYCYQEIRTPIFERTELFVRGVGETSDIVSKEMYTFLDRGERSMTLRPEGTAAVMRAFLEKKLHSQPGLYKYFYIGPMFRYERPQAGRYRQHHQFGVEAIGVGAPEQDAEIIDLACEIYRRLGLKNLNVMINSVGDAASRADYKAALTDYLTPYFAELSGDSQARFSKNILRILDSKAAVDQQILKEAPSILDFLSDESRVHFETVLKRLDQLKISYAVQPGLVRGLDYYSKTVFEVTSGELGAQNSVCGGGRYDGLIATLDGPDLPGIGFGSGLERLIQTMLKQGAYFPEPPHPFLFFIPLGAAAMEHCFVLASHFRHQGIPTEMDASGRKVQQGLSLASHCGAEYALVIGEDELASGRITLKKMATRDTFDLTLEQLPAKIVELYQMARA